MYFVVPCSFDIPGPALFWVEEERWIGGRGVMGELTERSEGGKISMAQFQTLAISSRWNLKWGEEEGRREKVYLTD